MIYLYSGTPGSGKSLHCARVMSNILKRGHPLIANFEIDTGRFNKDKMGEFIFLRDDFLSPDKLIKFSQEYFKGRRVIEGRITLVIDECQRMFDARMWNVKGRKEWLTFFSLHRHYGYDIILIAQFDRMIDRQIRCLVEYETIHRKVSNFGWKGKLFSAFCLGNLFVAVRVWYPMKEKIGSDFFIARKKLYSLYDTYQIFDADSEGGVGGPPVAVSTKQQECSIKG